MNNSGYKLGDEGNLDGMNKLMNKIILYLGVMLVVLSGIIIVITRGV